LAPGLAWRQGVRRPRAPSSRPICKSRCICRPGRTYRHLLQLAATYATGLADSTYQNQFANAQQRFSDYLNLNTAQQGNLLNQYNRLSGVATLGANAGAQVGSQGATLANQAGSALQAAGNAQAAGTMGAANAVTNGLNSYLGYQSLQNALKAPSPTTGGYLTSGGYSNAPPTPVSMPIIPPSA
jgi:hypothetical protein